MDVPPPRRAPRLAGQAVRSQIGRQGRASEQPLHHSDDEQSGALAAAPTIRRACRFPRSCSAAAAPPRCRWCWNPRTGRMAFSWARRWARKPPRPRPEQSAWCGAIRWRCCRSAATTWVTTGRIGCAMRDLIKNPPKIFMVNWFRKGAKGNFLWPGYGENLRVLKWMLDRIYDRIPARKTAVGSVPDVTDLDLTGPRNRARRSARGAQGQARGVENRDASRRANSSTRSARRCPPNCAAASRDERCAERRRPQSGDAR